MHIFRVSFYRLLWIIVACWFCACQSQHEAAHNDLCYARFLKMEKQDNYTLVSIVNPWDSVHLLDRFVLLPRGEKVPKHLGHIRVLHTPQTACVPLSTVHAALALKLGAAQNIVGLADAEWVVSPTLKAANFPSAGVGMSLNVERLAALKAQLLLSTPFENERHKDKFRGQIVNIPCVDYMEPSPLGRAEWIKFFGLLWGCEAKADSLFAIEELKYQNIVQQVSATHERPKVMTDVMMQGAWYVPGGRSYVAQVIADAGGHYLFAENTKEGSINVSVEEMLQRCAQNADVWVIKHHDSKLMQRKALAQDNKIYTQFRPWQERALYYCNTLEQPYYEDLPFAPSVLLQEWAKILHPSVFGAYRLQYFRHMH